VRWIVFPRFVRSAARARLKRLKRVEALRLLLANCGWVQPLDWATIGRTTEWLSGIASYAATYSSLASAIEMIDSLPRGAVAAGPGRDSRTPASPAASDRAAPSSTLPKSSRPTRSLK
jgi:hypothetical protein